MYPARLVATQLCIVLLLAVPALAEGPDRLSPDQPTVRPQVPVVPSERLACDDPFDARCRTNPCSGQTEIYGIDTATCTPCLDNSVATLNNRACACVAGYVQASLDQWGRATCVAEQDQPPPAVQMQTVTVGAGDFLQAVNALGFPPQIEPPPLMICTAGKSRGTTWMELHLVPSENSLLGPPPFENQAWMYTCTMRLFGARLINGWEFVGLSGVTDNGSCDWGINFQAGVTKRNADPHDTTHDAVLRAWAGHLCGIRIEFVELRGPAGMNWKTALGF